MALSPGGGDAELDTQESLSVQEEVAMQRRSETYGEATLRMGLNGNEWSAWS